jgi:hypothetical protein
MARVVVVIMASLLLVSGVMVALVDAGGVPPCAPPTCAPPPPPCPPRTLVTRMVPCTRTEMVAEVIPFTRTVPVQKIGFRTQKVLLKGIPTGQPCGLDPCTKCCPQPFCQVVDQKVPYVYYEKQCIPDYRVVYKPICRPVMLPQTYMVEAYPLCR